MRTLNQDILNETHGIIVQGVNAQGKMGSGIAKQIAIKYPKVYLDYMNKYATDGLRLGDTLTTCIDRDFFIASGVTQQYYGRDENVVYVDYDAVRTVFQKINTMALMYGLPVKFPLIGCGLANGDWDRVKEIIGSCLDPSIERTLFILP